MMGRLTTTLLLLAGCAHTPPDPNCPPLPDPERIRQATQARWEQQIGPLPLHARVAEVRVRQMARGEFEGCAEPPVGYVEGCHRYLPVAGYHDVQVLQCDHNAANALAHEYAHVLLRETTGDPDREHKDMRVWGPVASPREAVE